ncbi:MAG: hypothetical protein Q8R79_04635 [Legionellaceae bacterium]|nr:hypothetical protein [Legionellaceae bacterium]
MTSTSILNIPRIKIKIRAAIPGANQTKPNQTQTISAQTSLE